MTAGICENALASVVGETLVSIEELLETSHRHIRNLRANAHELTATKSARATGECPGRSTISSPVSVWGRERFPPEDLINEQAMHCDALLGTCDWV